MNKIFIFLVLFFSSFQEILAQDSTLTKAAAPAPADNLNLLLKERSQMIKDYEFYNSQNSNFWGKKSKKDLLNIIEVLKKVINKDSEIIREINQVNLRRQAQIEAARVQAENERKQIQSQSVDDKRVVSDNLYAFKTQIQNLENQQKVKQRQLNAMQESLTGSKDTIQKLQLIIALAVAALLGLTIFTFTRSGKNKVKR